MWFENSWSIYAVVKLGTIFFRTPFGGSFVKKNPIRRVLNQNLAFFFKNKDAKLFEDHQKWQRNPLNKSGQIIIFYQRRFAWNKAISPNLNHLLVWGRVTKQMMLQQKFNLPFLRSWLSYPSASHGLSMKLPVWSFKKSILIKLRIPDSVARCKISPKNHQLPISRCVDFPPWVQYPPWDEEFLPSPFPK